jgi:raffinose/stachyose/melibiose transport system permease protein
MFFMPNLIGGLILGYIWRFILSDAFKAIGERTGMTSIFFNWLLVPHAALVSLVVVITWQMAGYVMIIYITGIQSVPDEVMEAAVIDGATGWKRFFRIELPLIMPSVTICTFYSLSNCFKIYDINLSLTGGGPGVSTEMFRHEHLQ